MPNTVIAVDGLSKRYRLGHAARHDTLRDALAHRLSAPWRWLRRSRTTEAAAEKPQDQGPAVGGPWSRGPSPEDFWALRDVSFEVQRGEVLGVIGRNGAGKSTLLKILSRITEPTTGRVALRGRVASLLEVGTGFHSELSGRENVFLNGAILGMSRTEIRRKFDEIVAFAEVERFLDTPVKHYSSGMYVRLAFAVAAHLEPEILIVDEVLAVGDVQFQQKCLGKMQAVSRDEGRTVLFVSHQTDAVRALCDRCLWLSEGHITRDGDVHGVIRAYMDSGAALAPAAVVGARGTRLTASTATPTADGAGLSLVLEFESASVLHAPHIGLVIRDSDRRPVLGTNTQMHAPVQSASPSQRQRVTVLIPFLPLHGDDYHVSVYLGDHDEHLLTVDEAVQFRWTPPRPVLHRPPLKDIGPVNTTIEWKFLTP